MVGESDWAGRVGGRNDDFDELQVVAVLEPGRASWGSPFQVRAGDGHDYFVKVLEGCTRNWARGALVAEYVVSRVGALIGAPVCQSSLIRIPEELRGHGIARGVELTPGIGHASRTIRHADEVRDRLGHRRRDDNRSRHVGLYALYDWCYGDDPQWLHDLEDDYTVYSHDHGLYLPPNTGEISPQVLRDAKDEPNELPDVRNGLNAEAVALVADALEKIDREVLVNIMCGVPASWPATDEELATLGWFLEYRAPVVAGRVRNLIRREG
ncbi:HipA family kinase [Streptosporangium sp. NPDC049046]|uniref:HipA family kinase n=1 Tax=Streptosporangium sp. NPDC049046 TaxID=3155031 RepID=UPI0034212C90